MTLDELKGFEQEFQNTIPEGKFQQLSHRVCRVIGVSPYSADTDTDMSIVNLETKQHHKVGSFNHEHYAGYVEKIINAYRNGDLVHKDSLITD